jgi:hypothetical protein
MIEHGLCLDLDLAFRAVNRKVQEDVSTLVVKCCRVKWQHRTGFRVELYRVYRLYRLYKCTVQPSQPIVTGGTAPG